MSARSARQVAVACAALFGLIMNAVVTEWSPLFTVDSDLADGLGDVVAPEGWLAQTCTVVSAVFHPTVFRVVTAASAVALWVMAGRRARASGRGLGRLDPPGVRWLAIFMCLTVGVGGLLSTVVKILVGRPRPVDPIATAHGMSFPSGHTVGVTVAALVLLIAATAVRGRRPPVAVAVAAGFAVAAVGFSRLALGVHFLSDVVGGCLLAASSTAALLAAFPGASRKPGPSRTQRRPDRAAVGPPEVHRRPGDPPPSAPASSPVP